MIQTTVKVSGMACSMCEAHVNDTIRRAFSVEKVSSSHAKGETVILSKAPLDENALRAADLCDKAGYRSARDLRSAVTQDRRAGIPILSSGAGYFLPDAGKKGQREAAAFYRSMRSRAVNVFQSASAAWGYLGVLPEQIAMEERESCGG